MKNDTSARQKSIKQSLEQQRARAAWEHTPEKVTKEYLSVVRGAGATIMTSGLGQALAFWISKETPQHDQVANALAKWLHRELDAPDAQTLMGTIRECDSREYRKLTTEAMAYLQWLKRFAEGRSTKDGSDEGSLEASG